jgi:hypothetical protein
VMALGVTPTNVANSLQDMPRFFRACLMRIPILMIIVILCN